MLRRLTGLLTVSATLWLASVTGSAQTAAPFPDRAKQIIQALYERHTDLARGTDDDRRELTKRIIEQIVFEMPGNGFGWKSADPHRPPSKDCIAREWEGRLFCWDWQNGATREPHLEALAHDITGQWFIAVEGKNHLGVAPGDGPGPGDAGPGDASAELAQLQALVQSLTLRLQTAEAKVTDLELALNAQARTTGTLATRADALATSDAQQTDRLNALDGQCVVGSLWGVFRLRSCPDRP